MTNYFENAKTTAEVKETYKNLVKKYHPDVFGEKGNEILKDIHNQLEKALKKIDSNAPVFNADDVQESQEIKNLKKALAEEASLQIFPEGFLFAKYWANGLRPANHRNPLTQHKFSGWNIWRLELEMLTKGFESAEWSTFAQYKAEKQLIQKGQHGTYITLAIVTKKKDEEDEEKQSVYYKGYTVFNKNQTQEITDKTKAIGTSKRTATTWAEKYQTVA